MNPLTGRFCKISVNVHVTFNQILFAFVYGPSVISLYFSFSLVSLNYKEWSISFSLFEIDPFFNFFRILSLIS
jgi:hypothetical protein